VMLVGAMNPCPCGFHGTGQRPCRCPPGTVERYQRRLSGPLRDRFDLALDLAGVSWAELRDAAAGETTATIRMRVIAARERQMGRQGCLNSRLSGRQQDWVCRLDDTGAEALVEGAVSRFGLSARAVARVLRVARTIADLSGAAGVSRLHVAEALQF